LRVAYGRGSVLLRQIDEISQGKGAVLGVFFPTENALYSIAFETHAKMAEPIEMPFGMMNGLRLRNGCYVGVTIPEQEGPILGENICPTSPKPQ